MHGHVGSEQIDRRETLAQNGPSPHSALEIFYFLANYKSFPEFRSRRRLGREAVLTDNDKAAQARSPCPQIRARAVVQRKETQETETRSGGSLIF